VRVLVTGSRDWENAQLIYETMLGIHIKAESQPVLVSGHCPTGADAIAEQIAVYLSWPVERHPAKWEQPDGSIDKRAGFVRNKEMVDAGADICIAFIRNKSKGATMTADLAAAAGIELKVFRSNDTGLRPEEEGQA
jgi:hypothetical protein